MRLLRKFVRSEDGATAIEYTLIASLISIAAIAAFRTTGTGVDTLMTTVANAWR